MKADIPEPISRLRAFSTAFKLNLMNSTFICA